MTTPPALDSSDKQGTREARSVALERHASILKNVLFAQRNNPFFALSKDDGEAERLSVANDRFRHLISRQVPFDLA